MPMMAHTCYLSTWEVRWEDFLEFKGTLEYRKSLSKNKNIVSSCRS